jgi:hypothetical protein
MLCRFVSLHICIISNILFRGQLKSESMCRQLAQQKAAQRTQEEEAAALRVTEIIKAKVEEVMASEATQQRIQRRLKEERASLEDKVNCWSCMGALVLLQWNKLCETSCLLQHAFHVSFCAHFTCITQRPQDSQPWHACTLPA